MIGGTIRPVCARSGDIKLFRIDEQESACCFCQCKPFCASPIYSAQKNPNETTEKWNRNDKEERRKECYFNIGYFSPDTQHMLYAQQLPNVPVDAPSKNTSLSYLLKMLLWRSYCQCINITNILIKLWLNNKLYFCLSWEMRRSHRRPTSYNIYGGRRTKWIDA